ncbi:MAG TPA: hypothetical protein VGL56_20080 [Fimbriimonadaceae bacterium]|jgi:hypothetical protein
MVLTVPYEEFAAACKRVGAKEVYLSANGKGTLLTVADTHKQVVIACKSSDSLEEISQALSGEGFTVLNGRWGDGSIELAEAVNGHTAFVAAVAYQSHEATPGLWMDAFPTPPTPLIVLRTMFEEFKANSEIGEVTYEEFVRYAKPNVVILTPGDISTYLAQKEEC